MKKQGSTIPQGPKKLPPKTAAEVLGVDESKAPDYATAGLDDTFADLVRQRQKLAAKRADLEGKIKDLTSTIGEFLTEAKVGGVTVDGEWAPKWSAGRVTEILNVQKLIEKGVSAKVIAECTDRSQGAPYIRVDKLGARGR